MKATLFKNARILRNGAWAHEDLCVENGQFIKPTTNAEIVDLKGHWILPGLIDVHTHLRDGALSAKETYVSGAEAAAAGGFTTCFAMANGDPIADTPEKIRSFFERVCELPVKLLPVGAVTKGLEGKVLVDFQRMKDAGCVAFSDDGQSIMNSKVLATALQWSEQLGFVVILHEEDRFLSPVTGMNAGLVGLERGLPMSHECAESSLLSRDAVIFENLAPLAKVHIAHVSSAHTLEIVNQLKKRGRHASCEVTPHHLYFVDDIVSHKLGFAKMSPPLRSEATRQALLQGVRSGAIDMIATDHAPHMFTEKKESFAACPCGVVGLETAVSTLWTLCQSDETLFVRMIRSMSEGPSKVFGCASNTLALGAQADFFVFSPQLSWKVSGATMHSKAKHTPWEGETLMGRVTETWCSGRRVYRGEG